MNRTRQASEPTDTILTRIGPERQPGPFARGSSYVLQRYSLVILWLIMIILFVILLPNLDLGTAARAVLGQQNPIIFLGLGTVILLAVGEFDLSFAWVFGLSGTVVPALVVLHGWPVGLAVVVALASALIVGLLNAILVVLVGVNSIVVTLGTGSLALGVALLLSNQANVSGLDPALSQIALGQFLGLPAIFWYGVILVAIAAYVMGATPLGRHMLFVGSNRDVARLAGVPVKRIRFGAYLVSALLSGIAGLVLAFGVGGFSISAAQVQLMPVFAAVFLGTVAVIPGRFNPIGMLIAAYFLLSGVFGLQLLGASGWVTNIFYGTALVIAVTVSLLVQRRKAA